MANSNLDGSTPVIRRATLADFSALLSLYSELTGGLPVLDGDAGLQKLKEILEHKGTHIFGAEVSGRLVSVATIHICPNLTFGGRSYARIENVVTLALATRTGWLDFGVLRGPHLCLRPPEGWANNEAACLAS